jgi:hypothetical protein
MITRAANTRKHPGQVVVDGATRRPKEVVQAERASKAAEKERIATAQEEGIKEVAQIENDVRKKRGLRFDQQKDELNIPRRRRAQSAQKPRAVTPDDQGKMSPVSK